MPKGEDLEVLFFFLFSTPSFLDFARHQTKQIIIFIVSHDLISWIGGINANKVTVISQHQFSNIQKRIQNPTKHLRWSF